MCIWTMENNWGQLKGQLKRDDILVISTLKELSDMHSGIREKLQYCKESGVRICLKGICLQEDIYMDFLSVMEAYRRKTNLKKSTFYKYARMVLE